MQQVASYTLSVHPLHACKHARTQKSVYVQTHIYIHNTHTHIHMHIRTCASTQAHKYTDTRAVVESVRNKLEQWKKTDPVRSHNLHLKTRPVSVDAYLSILDRDRDLRPPRPARIRSGMDELHGFRLQNKPVYVRSLMCLIRSYI